ncbi:hypothetical protein GO491_01205 [Flavobacteriaceae bacterium Ap0902]|nr:hypothetical protein [Flavobacteriaceae bacterium Ap0902]
MKTVWSKEIVEDLQWMGGNIFDNKCALKSAYNPQDFYSNRIGAKYRFYELINRGFKTGMNIGNNFAIRFTNYIYGLGWN